ncbi:MAG: carbamoyl phosphate synthase small subunit [Bdellovibrionales bacterium RIFCSPHIGHO2_01_FULL_40_29]|nr:MAG: carbamoyl phosphate synthase small subunit [Bdellovibrionales bacterium RIFCSPHIGHO2_01_FULL_40_29]OFZ35455.1 MAG: carbamoyl phosphate synthase small subunit [Bdellovibrionales bacterium RIFCSPHIGHO2_02_FULL_40_15]
MKTFLVLQDGEIFEGQGLVAQNPFPEKAGEVVFNTAHSGYEEIASDPSYFSQIVVMTAPMMGNYAVNKKSWESKQIWIQGFVCVQMQSSERESSWSKCLIENQVPVMTEVDTRRLVLKLRNQGTPWGAIVQAPTSELAKTKAFALIEKQKNIESDWVHLCSRQKIEDHSGQNPKGPRIAVLDFGAKENILRELRYRSSAIRIFPSRTEASVIQDWKPDSLMLTNGPGDPAAVQKAPETIRYFIGKIPIFGICMGHQVLALALGAKTYKLKFGHRGANHPIRDEILNKIYISSQNHGYAVVAESLPKDIQVTHHNLNDGTVAGFYSKRLNLLGIQYHPESHPGPHEASQLFDFFIQNMHQNQVSTDQPKTAGTLC